MYYGLSSKTQLAEIAVVDKGTFEWLKEKYEDSSKAKRLKEVLNVDLSRVQYNELDFSPMLSLIFCRLRYMAVPDAIPKIMEGRADYWKRWYNSELGKGTPEEYLERCMNCGLRGGAL